LAKSDLFKHLLLEWHGLVRDLRGMSATIKLIRATTPCGLLTNEFRVVVRFAPRVDD
jgi:hypothetical protein